MAYYINVETNELHDITTYRLKNVNKDNLKMAFKTFITWYCISCDESKIFEDSPGCLCYISEYGTTFTLRSTRKDKKWDYKFYHEIIRLTQTLN